VASVPVSRPNLIRLPAYPVAGALVGHAWPSYIVGMRIGNLNLKGRAILAPLAGVSNRPFRLLAIEAGAAMSFTEMVSSEGIIRSQGKTLSLLRFRPDEQPIGIQLFGADPEVMREAAAIVAGQFRPDVIDINFGCSVRKVVRNHAGAALLKDLEIAERVIRGVVEGAGDIPVTIKLRSGWDESSPVYIQLGKIAEQTGVKAVTLHPRPASIGFAGKADWAAIGNLKKALSIPVIGNGDVWSPGDALRMLEETGCDAVMIGRAAMANPHVFKQVNQLLATGESPSGPSLLERINLALKHARLMSEEFGEERGIKMMRRHLVRYAKGFPGAARIRPLLVKVCTTGDIARVFDSYLMEDLYDHGITGVRGIAEDQD